MDRKRSNNIFFILQVLLFLAQEASCFRGHFSRKADLKLNFNPLEYFSGRFTVYDCTALCGSSDKCKSVGYELANKACHIYDVNSKDNGANETEVKGYDLYERISMSYFTRISNHHLPVQKRLELTTTDLEECAWRCISESRFDCYGFNHLRTPSTCFLINASPVEGSLPAIYSDTMDFYERTIDYGPMNNFLNFGSGMLWPFGGKVFYNHTFRGISVEQCAQRCLDERKFRCASFDYLHDKDLNFCLLSDTSVMAGHANLSNVTLANCNHFERIDTHLGMFHPILYASSLVKKVKETSNASPEDCAKQCIDEREFVCRSFDYQVEGGGTCLFSYESTSNEESVVVRKDDKIAAHHFDLMPVYICGENLTLPGKSLFSPGWPLKYAPNEECIWHISASSNQIITIDFFHLELGDGGKCDADSGDRLLITDFTPEGQSSRPICLPSKTTKYVTKSSKVVLRFVSDGENEDLGFRASYTADWTCNAVLKRSPGEIASSGYPLRSYPPRSSCTWRLWSSNPKHRIRLDFLYFRLQEHPLGHCTENADHIKVIDGGKVQSPTIGIYCGVMPPFFVISAGKELLVQFRADSEWKDSPDDRKKGFRASYSFEEEMGLNRTIFDRTKDVHPPRADYSFWEEMEEDDGSKFKFAMWSMVAILALVSIILSVSLLLLARYHRKQMMKYEGSFSWPWKTEIVSMKLLKSLKRMRKQDGDLNSNNLILNNAESNHEVGASREDCSNSTQRDSSPPPSKFSRSSSKYKRLNDNNIYLGDAQNFLRSDFH